MQWLAASIVVVLSIASAAPTYAQVVQQDNTLQQQLVADSFKLEASAISSKFNWFWNTRISYVITNNTGMNLYLGVMQHGVTFGSCTDAQQISGSLQFLPSPHAVAYSYNPSQGLPRGEFVPAGAQAAGTIILANCATPNPGYPTAPLPISLMLGTTDAIHGMTTFPLHIDAPIRMIQPQ
jgi:hypothetical protein